MVSEKIHGEKKKIVCTQFIGEMLLLVIIDLKFKKYTQFGKKYGISYNC